MISINIYEESSWFSVVVPSAPQQLERPQKRKKSSLIQYLGLSERSISVSFDRSQGFEGHLTKREKIENVRGIKKAFKQMLSNYYNASHDTHSGIVKKKGTRMD